MELFSIKIRCTFQLVSTLIEELKARGYKGTLTYEQVITL